MINEKKMTKAAANALYTAIDKSNAGMVKASRKKKSNKKKKK